MKYTLGNVAEISRVRVHDSMFVGFEYKAKESNVYITCKNEYYNKTYSLKFLNVICVYMQACRFWGPSNSVQCMYKDEDKLIEELRKEQRMNEKLYDGSRLAEDEQVFAISIMINSGDVLTICCSEVEVEETDE